MLLREQGPAAVRDFAINLSAIGSPEAVVPVIQLLDKPAHTSDLLMALAHLCRAHPERLDILEIFGRRVRACLPAVGMPNLEVPDSVRPFATVIGSSYVRSFGRGTRFFPLFIGTGPMLTFLTPELAATTKTTYLNNVERADPGSLVILMGGNADAAMHVRNDHGTWDAVERGELPLHDDLIRRSAKYYIETVMAIRRQRPRNLVLLAAFPMLGSRETRFVNIFNAEVLVHAESAGIPFLDLTEHLRDSATGCLQVDLCAGENDDHIGHALLPLVESGLKTLGLLPEDDQEFEWQNMWRFTIGNAETKIWSEPYSGPGNVLHSRKIMFTQIVERALNIFIGALGACPGSTAVVLNGGEGFVACGVPIGMSARTISVDVMESRARVGGRIANFLRRRDVTFGTAANIAASAEHIPISDVMLMIVGEGDDCEECILAIECAAPKITRHIFVLTGADLSERLARVSDFKIAACYPLSNRLITGYWAQARLILLSR